MNSNTTLNITRDIFFIQSSMSKCMDYFICLRQSGLKACKEDDGFTLSSSLSDAGFKLHSKLKAIDYT